MMPTQFKLKKKHTLNLQVKKTNFFTNHLKNSNCTLYLKLSFGCIVVWA